MNLKKKIHNFRIEESLFCVSFVSRDDWRFSARVDSVEEHEIVYRYIELVCVFVGEFVSVLIVRFICTYI